MKDFLERVKELNNRSSLMDGKEKGANIEIEGKTVTLSDYEFRKDERGETYAVYTVKEIENTFFFAGMDLSQKLVTLDEEGYKEQIKKQGLPMKLHKLKTKKGREFYTVDFLPKD